MNAPITPHSSPRLRRAELVVAVSLLFVISGALAIAAPGGQRASSDSAWTPPGQAKKEQVQQSQQAQSPQQSDLSDAREQHGGGHGVDRGGSTDDGGGAHSGNGQNRGGSQSDPDGSSNGGSDKPGGTQGGSGYHDGNNGCGNDPDREDDNRGNCGRRPKPADPIVVPPDKKDDPRSVIDPVQPDPKPDPGKPGDKPDPGKPGDKPNPGAPGPKPGPVKPGPKPEPPPVRGGGNGPAPAPAPVDPVVAGGVSLPFTGAPLVPMAVLGLAMMLIGLLQWRAGSAPAGRASGT